MQFVHFVQYVPYSLFYFQLLLLQQRALLVLPDMTVFEAYAYAEYNLNCRAIQPGSPG